MLRITDLELFVRSSALGSFTAAAHEADLLPGQVAAAIKRLERDLDVRLFARTTRSLRLTAEGELYLPTALSVLQSLRQGRDNLHGAHSTLRGVLQVSAPSDLGRNILLPWLSDFRREHPELTLRLHLSDHVADLFRDPVDVAIRYGLNEEANYIALPLAPWNRRVLVASPAYLARHGRPQALDDLQQHACLLYLQQGRTYDKWRLGNRTVQVSGPLFSDDADVVRRWAVLGEGIAYKSWLDVSANVATGELEVLLPEHPGELSPVTLVCPHRKQLSPAVSQLHLWLRERFAAQQPH
ncbi:MULTISPECIES: LysR family transcriptional regulator [Pseudomonas]|jgi:DNA-binding transcriptional LysR family regulator|uniref:Transcriptional regulator, LysR family n=1 Tax=Pseudomonas putida (strain W619) TaxID=390235 RepID=B1JA00_PSEPW|nr:MULTISPECIES: LysR family transcriptional regulator [Pseudomonas]MDH1574779.1 LysR family transcriptional regulator [Pseudomonas sp. GD03746]QQE82059.1 LysR family transcriptional regulator [Pseudomonas putida]UTL79352.1 LysR family transcriptional regulator [Pseudomonas putida]HEN8711021.1 LysR family transcriptional regulator [Pseudomonas putida]HEN8716090.1 LysR family transcriptional regulator [Pseudomonas putida]